MATLALALFGRASARRLTIAAAIPDGFRRAPSQAAFIRAVQADPVLAQLRADAYAHQLAVGWVLACHADWTSLCSRPTWERIAELAGVSRSTVQRCIRRLRRRGLLGVVETGSTEATRGRAAGELNSALPPDHPDRIDGNRAAEYVLCVPSPAPSPGVDVSDPPSMSPLGDIEIPTRARETGREDTNRTHRTGYPQERPVAVSLALCERLRLDDLTLRRCSARMLRHLLRPLLAAGATAADVRHALHHAPDGTPWSYTTDPRHVAAWIRWRLSHWLAENGALTAPLPSQLAAQRAERARDHLAAQQARTARHSAERAAAAAIAPGRAAQARAMLLASLGSRAAARLRAAM